MAGAAEAAGAALTLVGAAWVLWAAHSLRRAGNPLLRGVPRRLVDDGPYRLGRHPMLLGLLVALAGAALTLRSPGLALATAALALAADRWWVPAEERHLRQAFGGWYSDYAIAVRRWV